MAKNCGGCGMPMIVLDWNSSVDVLVCDNSSCGFFRQPTPVPKSRTTIAEELGSMYSRHRRRPKMKKHAAFTFEERLQELREDLST